MLFPNENLEIDRYISLRDIPTFGKTLLLNADLDKSIYPCYCLIQYYVVVTGVSIKDTEKKIENLKMMLVTTRLVLLLIPTINCHVFKT